jgi:DUF1365 family protein
MDLDMRYRWRLTQPGNQLLVHIENEKDGNNLFDATLVLQRKEISSGSLARVLVQFPFLTAKIVLAIYWEALRLWIKKVPFVDHPKNEEAPTSVKNP